MVEMVVYPQSLLDVPDVEAVVIPANKQLKLGWGSHIAETVLKMGGISIEMEALSQYPKGIELGEAIVTSTGRLPFRWLIHAAVLNQYDFNPLFLLKLKQRTSDETLWSAVLASLAQAENHRMRSLAFSPMGAGIGGMPIQKNARIIVEACLTYFQGCPNSSIQKVVLAVMKKKDVGVFEEKIRSFDEFFRARDRFGDELLNEIRARIVSREFQVGITILREMLGIELPDSFFKDFIQVEHERLVKAYRLQGEDGLLKRLSRNTFELRGWDIVKNRGRREDEAINLIRALAFDLLLLAIKSERRRLLGLYYEGGHQPVLEELKRRYD